MDLGVVIPLITEFSELLESKKRKSMTAVQLSTKLTPDQESQEIRRSSRAKTPSLLYSEEFEEKPWVSRKNPTKTSNSKEVPKSQKKTQNDIEMKIEYEELARPQKTPAGQEFEYQTNWMPFILANKPVSPGFSKRSQLQANFVVNDTSSVKSTARLTESLVKIPTVVQPKSNNSTAPASVIDLPNDKTQAKLLPNTDAPNGGRYHIRKFRKKKNFDDQQLLGNLPNRTKKRIKLKPTNAQKRKVHNPQPQPKPQKGSNQDFLDMVLSAAINAQANQKKNVKSPARTNSHHKRDKANISGQKKSTRSPMRGIRLFAQENDSNFSEEEEQENFKLNRPKPVEYLVKAEKQDGTLVLYHTSMPAINLKFVRPKFDAGNQKEILETSALWGIAQPNSKTSSTSNLIHPEGSNVDKKSDEEALKAYLQQRIKQIKPRILQK